MPEMMALAGIRMQAICLVEREMHHWFSSLRNMSAAKSCYWAYENDVSNNSSVKDGSLHFSSISFFK